MSILGIHQGQPFAAPSPQTAAGTSASQAGSVALNPNTAVSGPPDVTRTGNAAEAAVREPGSTPPAREEIESALNKVAAALEPVARDLHFSIDDDTGRTVIKIIDSSTDELIRQIPSEEILAIAKALDKLQGLLIKQEA